ncbi:MAG: 4Fe-4S dicluster domain-containing protein [Oscillospiraceae bacterium]|nr:4Fe-4S dicluster domain-containing protein [Oscillospiraceae bacterium]
MLLPKEKLSEALGALAAEANVIAPVKWEGDVFFMPYKGGDVCLEGNGKLPPKDVLFPKTEKMYSYSIAKGTMTEHNDAAATILFGVRSCDAASIERLDKVFLEQGYKDGFYSAKREGLAVIAMGCDKPMATCFCTSMGIDPMKAEVADVQMCPVEGGFTVEAVTEKGKEIVKKWDSLLDKKSKAKPAKVECSLNINVPEDFEKKLMDMFESPIWDDVTKACLGCACCTYVCPTCYCFDINQDVHGDEGTAFRCWDSCMFSDYTRMAGGHNPRPSKKERLRNRYLHKLAYYKDRHGKYLCVGCGRCIANCPAHLDITAFAEKAMEVE